MSVDLDPKLNAPPAQVHDVFLMGIGGVAMGALAGALKDQGYSVRGSDRALYPPMSTFLAQKGIPVSQGFEGQGLRQPPLPDLVIVGNVIRRDYEQAQVLAELKLPYISLPQAMAHYFIRDRISMVVAGTHGKTTTTAMIAEALEQSGADPGFMIGGLLCEDGRNFAEGKGRHFVIEGDEYDCAFFDKRPKFIHYRTRIGVLTSCEFDHADIYADFGQVQKAFDLFVQSIPAQGRLIAWGDSPQVMARAQEASCPVITYGAGPANAWRLSSAQPTPGGGAGLEIADPDGRKIQLRTPLAGEHNALNATAALAALCQAGLHPPEAARCLAGFGGVRRRQEVRGLAGGVVVVDDFAHHPTAVHETIKAVARFGLPGWSPGKGRLVAVFEPRSNTSRRNHFQAEYAQAFGRADLVFLREPPGVEDLPPAERFSSAQLAEDLRRQGRKAWAFIDSDVLLDGLLKALRPGDLCLIMSNGGFDDLHQRLLDQLQNRPQAD
ncbi:MAG: Mur ligase family protein [Desulfarculaceae bacterium]|jgi:UDP-N-acetylmuramate: L-alanyl-gamma-D-glutamyl-meso-diaminopimelate ligase